VDKSQELTGSSSLTAEQQEWYEKHFGVRYLAVAEQPFRPSRRVRRGRPRDAADMRAYDAQQQVMRLLAGRPLKAQVK
jgi:hypothetical protein